MKELRKPSVSAWATNQVARRNELDLRRLLKAGERLRAAQLEAAAEQDPGALGEAQGEQRRAIDLLVKAAGDILGSAGHAASDATLGRVATNLRTGAVTDDGRRLLERGVLADDLGSAGFDAFAGLTLPPPGARKKTAKGKAAGGGRPSARERRLETARAKLAQAEEEAAGLDEEAAMAERALEEARRALERAEREAERLRGRADRARDRVERAQGDVDRAR